ncbi:MAG: hypothetical protein QW197_03030 [Candidatus Aenigmatarchaeota archaeon]
MNLLLLALGLLDAISALIIIFNLSDNFIFLFIALLLLIKGLWSIISSF